MISNLGLYFTDVHAHNYRQFDNSGSRLENCLDVIEYNYKFAHKNGIKVIMFGGDLLVGNKPFIK